MLTNTHQASPWDALLNPIRMRLPASVPSEWLEADKPKAELSKAGQVRAAVNLLRRHGYRVEVPA